MQAVKKAAKSSNKTYQQIESLVLNKAKNQDYKLEKFHDIMINEHQKDWLLRSTPILKSHLIGLVCGFYILWTVVNIKGTHAYAFNDPLSDWWLTYVQIAAWAQPIFILMSAVVLGLALCKILQA